jgi:phenylpropionate dioxygenase-like ring-hydroxylating dioxygenase large terminal subunit
VTYLTNTDPALARAWHPVARSSEVGADPVAVRLLGEDWVLVRLPSADGGTTLAAFVDRCPHRLAPLSAGWVDGTSLRCGYHGWCFAADGHCTEIPALGATDRFPPRARAAAPAGVREVRGLVFLAPQEPAAPFLDVPEADDPSFSHGELPAVRAHVGAGLMIDNFLDIAHFPFVHAATIGTAEAAIVDDLEIERDGLAMAIRSRHVFPHHEDPGVATGERPLLQHRSLVYEYRAPFAVSLRIHYEEAGGTNVVEFVVQPEDDDHCRLYSAIHRNDLDDDGHRLAEAVSFETKILDEDLRLQERFVDHRLPLDVKTEVHVRADRMTVELRRILAAFVGADDTDEL